MRLGMIGLGRMGANMTERLLGDGHEVIGYDPKAGARSAVADKGAETADSLESLVEQLEAPRAIWMMVPAGEPVDRTLEDLEPRLSKGDVLADGGNSYYKDTLRRASRLKDKGILFVDVGTSGGVWGLKEGYSMMVGGEEEAVGRLRPALETLAPGPEKGWGHVGSAGSGHFVKMIHNGIEYGAMQAYAEGFALLRRKKDFNLDLHQVAEIWRYGSVVRSWLLDLIARALDESPDLDGIAPYVEDSGEGRWTLFEAIEQDLSTPAIALALLQRFRSREEEFFAEKLLAAMRHQFGGHAIKKES